MFISYLRALARRSRALCLVIFANTFFASHLHAQATWSLVAPISGSATATTATLWGVCYGGGQFVAVGERGTILTSPDGLAWTPRTSGTTAWLTSVAYGFNHYVAVGADRTILFSFDAITWAPFLDLPPFVGKERLNVVGFERDRFLAYGERDFVLSLQLPLHSSGVNSSSEGLPPPGSWRAFAPGLGRTLVVGETGLAVLSPDAPYLFLRLPTNLAFAPRTLSGIVFAHDTFTAVGDSGTIVTSTDAITWTAQPVSTTASLQAIAAFNNTLVAVGSGGSIFYQAPPSVWTAARNPATADRLLALAASDTVAIAVGDNGTILRSTATPTAPSFALSPANVTETLGGAASLVVRARGSLPLRYQWSRNGITLPGETHFTLIRAPLTNLDAGSYSVAVTNSAGTTISAQATLTLLPTPPALVDSTFRADASLSGTPSALLTLPDGTLFLATQSPDRLVKLTSSGALDPTWASTRFDSAPTALTPQPNGRLLVGGSALANGQTRPWLVRLNRDGTLDPTFTASLSGTTRGAPVLAVQSDGKILVAEGGPVPLRLLPDGTRDPAFQPEARPPFAPGPGGFWSTYAVDATRDGKVLVAYQNIIRVTSSSGTFAATAVIRLQANGTVDPSFTEQRFDGYLPKLRGLDDGSALVIITDGVRGSRQPVTTARLHSDGTLDPGYRSPTFPGQLYTYIYADGRLLAHDHSQHSPIRYNALGTVDSTFTGGIGEATLLSPTADDRVIVAGDFTLYDGVPSNRLARLNLVSRDTLSTTVPRVLAFSADKTTVALGESITLRAAVTGSGRLTYDWSGAPFMGEPGSYLRTDSPQLPFAFKFPDQTKWIQLTVRNQRGETASARLDFTVLPPIPALVAHTERVSAASGRDITLTYTADPHAGRVLATWLLNGQLLIANDRIKISANQLVLNSATTADAGTYTVALTNAANVIIVSAPMVVTIDDSSRFTNLSTRAVIGGGEQVAIAGFVLSGDRARTIVVRGIGPGLTQFGVGDALAEPRLTIFDQTGTIRSPFALDDWSVGRTDAAVRLLLEFNNVGAFPLPLGSNDAAIKITLPPGTYTAQLSSKTGQTGTALLELYEADNDAARILNLSTRALVTPAAPAFAGFAIRGPVAKTVLVRAAGPTLSAFGLAGPLAHLRLTVRDSTGMALATNSSWDTAPDRAALLGATSAVGAFAFAPGSNDAALLLTLPPGNYTAVIESTDTTSGLVLAEIYELPIP